MLPKSWSDQACGLDLHAMLIDRNGKKNSAIVAPNSVRKIPTGIAVECPRGYYAFVCSRSGLAGNSIFVANAPGVIDPDYRGEIVILLYNGGHTSHYVQHHDRIAQLVIMPFLGAYVREVDVLSETARGDRGFGSTGT